MTVILHSPEEMQVESILTVINIKENIEMLFLAAAFPSS